MSREDCIRSNRGLADFPKRTGRYLRALRDGKDTRRRYSDDQEGRYGLRVHPSSLRWEPDGLSVSCHACCSGQVRCAIELHVAPGKYHHVAEFDLQALQAEVQGIEFIVIAKPDDNPCHVIISSNDSDMSVAAFAVREALKKLEQRLPGLQSSTPPKRPPPGTETTADQALSEIERVVRVHKAVLGQPAPPRPATDT